jgi:hypothetical protein
LKLIAKSNGISDPFDEPTKADLVIPDVESLIHLQCRTNLDLVSIPDLHQLTKQGDYERYIREFRKYVEDNSDKEAVVIIDMNNSQDIFRMKIENVIQNNFNMIILRNRSDNEYSLHDVHPPFSRRAA